MDDRQSTRTSAGTVWSASLLTGALALYLLSIGPAVRLVFFHRLKPERLAIYTPVFAVTTRHKTADRLLEWYLKIWMPPFQPCAIGE